MRSAFIKTLHEAMRKDERIFLLIGDTGFNLVEPLFAEFPDRTLNVGIAEQNLIGIAAGLANVGFRPVCYAISNFLVHRCLEQTRNDLCLHDYPVVLVGTSAGFDNGALWATHYVVDDIGCLKPLPNMQIYSPSSVEAMGLIFEEVMSSSHPSYIRIPKTTFSEGNSRSINRYMPVVPQYLEWNNDSIKEKNHILLISHGKMVQNSLDAAHFAGNCDVYAMDRIKPLQDTVADVMFKYDKIFVIEDNFKSGLYNSLCEWAVERQLKRPDLYFIGPREEYGAQVGDSKYLEDKYGLSPEQIVKYIKAIVP